MTENQPTSPPNPDPCRPARPLLRRFERDWAVLRARPPCIAQARAWGVTERSFRDLDELLALAGFCVPSTPETDEVLRRLVAVARTDELAARVVFQRILPGLASVARRRRVFGDVEALEEVVGAAWIVIRTYRVETRPTHVAANLVRDSSYRAFIRPERRLSASEVTVDPAALDDRITEHRESSCDELARVLADAAAAGVPTADLELIRELLGAGSAAVAATRKVTARTVRNHRDRATARIRLLTVAA